MATADRVEALKVRHSSLETAIHEELARPHPDDDRVASLKKQKLKLKDEIRRLETVH